MLRVALLFFFLLASCRRERDLSPYTVEDPAAHLPARIEVGNTAQQGQLLGGFHQVEEGHWRWTARKFSVSLKPPFGAARAGAMLELKGSFPEAVFSKLGAVSLLATIEGKPLPAVTFTKPGNAFYSEPVPASLLTHSPVRVEFTLSQALPPGTFPGDGRELGLIVSEIALNPIKQ